MIVYFDSNGVVKEIITDYPVRQGSTNQIFCYFEDETEFTDLMIVLRLPDGSFSTQTSIIDNTEDKTIAYNTKADYKYFVQGKTYSGYYYTLTQSDLLYDGLGYATITGYTDSEVITQGLVTFNIESSVLKTDNLITQSQYEYLLTLIASRTLNEETASDLYDTIEELVIANIGVSPSVFDTAENILALTSNQGVAVATDTGYIYHWNDEDSVYENTGLLYVGDIDDYAKVDGSNVTDFTISGDLTVDGTTTIDGTLTVGATTEFTNDIAVNSADITQTNGSFTTNGTITGDEIVSEGDLTVNGTITAIGDITANSNVNVGNNLDVVGDYSSAGKIDIAGNIITSGTITADGEITASTITATSDISASGNISASSISTSGTITADGDITTSGNLSVSGDITNTSGNLIIAGNITAQDTISSTELNVSDDATIGGDLTVDGDLIYNGSTSLQTTISDINDNLDDKADRTNTTQTIIAGEFHSVGTLHIQESSWNTYLYPTYIYRSGQYSYKHTFPNKSGTFALDDDISDLQTQIDTLSSVQNVVDIVETYADLEDYDTSDLLVNDKIQVIADENYDDATTIYNWNGSSWVYVGAYGGNAYTKVQTDALLSEKADLDNVTQSIHAKSFEADTYEDVRYPYTRYEIGTLINKTSKYNLMTITLPESEDGEDTCTLATTDDVAEVEANVTTLQTDLETAETTITTLQTELETQSLTFTSVTADTWVSDTTYTDYPYSCTITCSGVTSDLVVSVIFDVTEAISGNYAPICVSGTDSVTIYSKVTTSITIPTIKVV